MDLTARRGLAWGAAHLATLRPLPLVVLVAWLAAPAPPAKRLPPAERSLALVHELRARGLEAEARDVHFVDPIGNAFASRRARPRALVRARARGENWDVYLVRTRLSPEGSLLGVDGVYDLTRTFAVGERELSVFGRHAAWTIGDSERTYRVELGDIAAEPRPEGDEWTRVARVERALIDLEQTGQTAGVGRRSFKLDPAARHVELTLGPTGAVVLADEHRVVIPWNPREPIEGQRFLREEERAIARPGNLVTWAVDRARALPWFGDERMQLVKAIAYRWLDRLDRAVGAVRPETTREVDVEDLGASRAAPPETNPEIGFPPPSLETPVTPPLPDEGSWRSLDNDPFTRTSLAVPTPLVTTYLRADGARPDSRVYIVEWDPRQVELDAVGGTEEPQSATGETGTGMVPRKPELLTRFIGAFNGGFQSTHGDFGMMSEGALLVPPKPYAATIGRLDDGATGFGTWPYDLTIPHELVSFRQNLTPLVANGKLNPYGRDWWGGVPHDWEDVTHTVRSGLCLTREGFVAYFYGTRIDHMHLGRAMLAARCDYGVHLDMNQGHTGLELYRVDRAEQLPSLAGKMDGHWQTEGDVSGMPGYRFRGRRLVRNLQLMHFPRYIRRGMRDFFYLMLRPLLPPEPLVIAGSEPGEGAWVVTGLPQHGFPNALAMTSLRPDPARPETKVRVLAVDPTMLRPASRDEGGSPVLTIEPPSNGARGVELRYGRGKVVVDGAPADAPTLVAVGDRAARAPCSAAVCVDPTGKLLYAEVATAPDPTRDAAALSLALDAAHCTERLFLREPLRVALGGARTLSDHPAAPSPSAIRLLRTEAPGARRLFPETPILPPQQWQPLQRQTRWFPKDPEPGGSSATPPAPSPEPP